MMNNYLTINTPREECLTLYPDFKEPFGREKKIQTHLPQSIALIRTVALAVFAAFVSCLAIISPFFWSVVVVQAGFGAWTLYSNLVAKDSLMEAFHKIVGGKDKFEELPQIDLRKAEDETLSAAIDRLDWQSLPRICRTHAPDGRNVIIVKVYDVSEELTPEHSIKTPYGIAAFVEKMGPWDYREPYYKIQHNNYTVALHVSYLLKQLASAILLYIEKNKCFKTHAIPHNAIIDDDKQVHWTGVSATLSSETANELFAQLNPSQAPVPIEIPAEA